MVTAYLGLGSNLGDRAATLRRARAHLDGFADLRVEASSALYETDPVGGPAGQPLFLNAVLQVATAIPAAELLRRCRQAEDLCGRQRLQRWGPRTLDADILLYGDLVCERPDLILPHPRLSERRFVLAPLVELAPELIHPVSGLTVRDLLRRLPPGNGVRRLDQSW